MTYEPLEQSDARSIRCRVCRLTLAGMLLLCVAFVSAFLFMAAKFDDQLGVAIMWISATFCAAIGLLMLPRFFQRGAQILIDERGIEDRRLGTGLIPWAAISSVGVLQMRRIRFLSIEPVDPGTFLASLRLRKRLLPRLNLATGFGPWVISFTDLHPGIDEVIACIQSLAPRLVDPESRS